MPSYLWVALQHFAEELPHFRAVARGRLLVGARHDLAHQRRQISSLKRYAKAHHFIQQAACTGEGALFL